MSLQSRTCERFVAGTLPAACLAALVLASCERSSGPHSLQSITDMDQRERRDHDHPKEGPHRGHLVELGSEAYKAEVVHDTSAIVAVYILDGDGKNATSIETSNVDIHIDHQGRIEQFELAAFPRKDDPAGTSSLFKSFELHLANDMDAKGRTAELVVTIDGVKYTGKIIHGHHLHESACTNE